jgi:hypothetical protein
LDPDTPIGCFFHRFSASNVATASETEKLYKCEVALLIADIFTIPVAAIAGA